MTQAQRIIDRFGGISKLAKALGHRHPSTVQGWRERGNIPPWQIRKIFTAAKQAGVLLDPTDFLPPMEDAEDEPPPTGARAAACPSE